MSWTKDIELLLDWKNFQHIDARLRFGNAHRFAVADDREIRHATDMYLDRLTGADRVGNLWMSETTYLETPLRAKDQGHDVWRLVIDEWDARCYERRERTPLGFEWVDRTKRVKTIKAIDIGGWLMPPMSVLFQEAWRCGLEPNRFLEVQVPAKDINNSMVLLTHDESRDAA